MQNFLKNFYDLRSQDRSMPFWGWNDRLDESELRRQIAIFKDMGFGGFYIHARVGLDVPYLQKEYFEKVQICIEEAEKQGLEVWLYDEDRWPSGTAGGIVSKNDKFKMKAIHLEKIEDVANLQLPKNFLGFYVLEFNADESDIISYRKIDSVTDLCLKEGESLHVASWRFMIKRAWFNGETYLDTMNYEAVTEFLKVTHESYKKHIGSEFGKRVKGIFNDEMGLSVTEIGCGVPYTENLIEKFEAEYGYNFLDFLPELFYGMNYKVSKVRYDFMNLVTSLFVNSSSKQIGEWCEKNNLQFIGHIFNEDTLSLQYCFNGAAMRFYEYMQCPGVDVLTEHWNMFVTLKQCVSVARQFGRKERMCELYACTGWDFPLTSHKASGDWQFALGINKFVPHIAWYTMKGEAKRDYPASISFQSPWYTKYSTVSDYLAGVKAVAGDNEEIRSLLVIHPIESFWSCVGRNDAFKTDFANNLHPKEKDFCMISQDLIANHLDYDYGDEEIIGRIGKASNGCLQIGCAEYSSVLIPEIATIRESTLTLLNDFAEQGGRVFYLGEIPRFVNAEKSSKAEEVYRNFEAVTLENYLDRLAETCRIVSLAQANGDEAKSLMYRLGKSENGLTFFVSNFGCDFSKNIFAEKNMSLRDKIFPNIQVELQMDFSGRVYEIDAFNRKIYPVESEYKNGRYYFITSFGKLESKLFLVTDKAIETCEKRDIIPDNLQKYAANKINEWDYELTDYNLLVLDHAKLEYGKTKATEEKYILEIDEILRDELGLQYRNDSMVQPYCRKYTAEQLAINLPFALEYKFKIAMLGQDKIFLALENPETYKIYLNGKLIENKVVSWWVDKAISYIELPKELISIGENTLKMEGSYNYLSAGVESIYILGKFGVYNDTITQLPKQLYSGDWCNQKLPYYSGNMIYRQKLPQVPKNSRVWVKIPDWRGCALALKINSARDIDLMSSQNYVEITEFLNENNNELQFTVYGHRRNGFGPFYLHEKQPVWTDSRAFRMVEREERNLVPCGILSEVEILIG